MGFRNSILGGINLVRAAIQSPNYVSGSTGWTVKQDGSAEFNNVVIRGGTVVSGLALYYNGTPAAGNLIMSISAAAGTDSFGNAYVKGVGLYGSSGQLVAKDAAGDTAIISGNIGGGGVLSALPGLALQPKFNTGGDPATIGALDPGDHATFSLLLTSPSPSVGGIPGTDFAQINMVGPYGAPCEIDLTAQNVAIGSTFFNADGVATTYGGDVFNTYTPTVGNTGGATWSTRTGWWVQVGAMRFVCIYLVASGAGSGTGIVTVSVPFNVDRTTRQVLTLHGETVGVNGGGTGVRGGECVFFVSGSGGTADRLRVDDRDGDGENNILGADILVNTIITIQGWLRAA
jgi:hypothetical protein